MKSAAFAAAAAFLAWDVAAHATFQALWVDGVDMGSQCARLPLSNSPVTNVASSDIRCNTGVKPVSLKCVVAAGSAVTVEMHQQPNDRSCGSDAIGGAHYGPVSVYLSKVSDATSADPSGGWFKIFEDSWAKKPSGGAGDDDFWGTKDLNKCCGKMSLKIPADIPAGDYLLRAEALALHTAASSGQAQFYMTCFQLQVTGGGSASPATVSFPGAYKASDPGILVDIHAPLATYIAPGPSVYSGGGTKSAGGSCAACESTCSPGKGTVGTATSVPGSGSTQTTTASSPGSSGGSGGGGSSGCSVAKYGQCGGTGYTGCTTCASGSSCSSSNQYYSQCL